MEVQHAPCQFLITERLVYSLYIYVQPCFRNETILHAHDLRLALRSCQDYYGPVIMSGYGGSLTTKVTSRGNACLLGTFGRRSSAASTGA